MYIIHPELEEAARKELIAYTTEIFTKMDAKILEVKEIGMRSLAYEIKKLKRGFYVLLNVEGTSAACDEFDRLIKINEKVLRHIIVRIDEVKPPKVKPDTRPKKDSKPKTHDGQKAQRAQKA